MDDKKVSNMCGDMDKGGMINFYLNKPCKFKVLYVKSHSLVYDVCDGDADVDEQLKLMIYGTKDG